MGASAGIGLSTLKHSLAAGYQCIALCRVPSKLTSIFPTFSTPNLKIIEGNAHDISVVSQCLQTEDGKLVDYIISTIGNKPSLTTFGDPEVCRKGMTTMLDALARLRTNGVTGKPYIIVASTTGMSRFGRDTPLVIVPIYNVILKVPHQDKRIMEDKLAASGEDYTVVRASFLLNGESKKEIRVGIEDPEKGVESKAIGYTISREDAGRWVAEKLVFERDEKYLRKMATITY